MNDKIQKHQWRKNIGHQLPRGLAYTTMWLAANGFFEYYHIIETQDDFCAGCHKRKNGGMTIINLPLNRYMAVCDECAEKTKKGLG